MTTHHTDVIGIGEAAEILDWSRTKLKLAAQSGSVPVYTKLPGRTGAYLFSRSAIEHIAKAAA